MDSHEEYKEVSRQSWNSRTEIHLKSDFYDLSGFLNGKTSLNPIELRLLGDIRGKSILHLQCHFGQDSISMSRLGAKVTGVDLSDKAIESAGQIAKQTQSDAQFICCDIYDLEQHLEQQFDMVYSSYGTINCLPDMDKWAKIISKFLKPKGKFIFVEFHPLVWMFDDDFEKIKYSYFNKQPIVEMETGTYADKKSDISQSYITWKHDLAEVIGSLLNNKLQLVDFQEYDYSPYDIFNRSVEAEPGKFRIAALGDKIPLVYSIVAQKSNPMAQKINDLP